MMYRTYFVSDWPATLCVLLSPFAFRALSVIATKGSAQNLGRLFDLPDIAVHIKEVSFHDTGADRRGRALNYVRSNAIRELKSSFSHIHQLPRLKAINLTFYPKCGDEINSDSGGRLALQASILSALAASFRVRVPSTLTSLSLDNLRTFGLLPFDQPPFQNLLTTLQRLQLTVLFEHSPQNFTSSSPWRHFWSTFCSRTILGPAQQSLTELTLHCDTFVGDSSGLSLAGLHFPRLTALSLRNFILQLSVGVEPFILRHAATLSRLELLTCKLPTYADPLPFPWEWELPSRSSGCWHSIWDRFAAELTALVALHVENAECSYVSAYFLLSFFSDSGNPPRDATDMAALQHFHAVVAARSEEMNRET
ncbi:hypothetical protein V8E53_003957 [Lactarius tabidus]